MRTVSGSLACLSEISMRASSGAVTNILRQMILAAHQLDWLSCRGKSSYSAPDTAPDLQDGRISIDQCL
ncbi:hypothetical protein [Bradyrhizobium uaiense]|uniref:Uncharacterized protein n=1 Tax=Bradyrhizobium uaiense TaxID=2594946 RepID=A0A6P1BA05_9BRAD|nr:hypothetical protein [Bradyrhizobium uaiense]NEU94262.1 hypothetical protein [Bradyrhizobium uaiense]